jgi:hypothetical protein
MNCLKIIEEYLNSNGFDGLFNADTCCGCERSELVTCGKDFSMCKPGYTVIPPNDVDSDFFVYICENKTDTPWEEE